MSAYYATGSPVQGAEQETLAPVLVAFAGSAPQSRLTVLVRLILAIPQLIVLWLLAIAAGVIAIIGWFGALFTGRLPVFAADYLTGYLRWAARVNAYIYLLTDVYPPFTLEDADYPIRLAVRPGRLNRLAVFFRLFLLIPCAIVQSILVYGALTVFQLASWLIVLISGRMPDPIYQAMAAVLRYQIRILAFWLMLTSAYPGGLFGDLGQPGHPAQAEDGAQAGYRTAGAPWWWLVLSDAARRLVIGFLVFGALVAVAIGVIPAAVAGHGVSAANAASQVSADATPVTNAIDNYATNVKACHGQLGCVTKLDRNVAATLGTFAAQLRTIQMPSQAVTADNALAASLSDTAGIYAKMGAATTASQYIGEAGSSGLTQSLNRVNQAYASLGTDLGE